jgi:hypothetical protein
MVLEGQAIGDDEACILGSGMWELGNLRTLDDARLGRFDDDPAALVAFLRVDELFHDATFHTLAESLDRWMIFGYVYDGNAIWLAQEFCGQELAGPILVSVVELDEYNFIVDMAFTFWSKNNGGKWVPRSRK